ncbi:MAG TPA: L,D-transpeptidase family protein [Allosphingosinicella sp.]|nr:L,D-transpeptidase family protein [Allosphingosinicella sp.]
MSKGTPHRRSTGLSLALAGCLLAAALPTAASASGGGSALDTGMVYGDPTLVQPGSSSAGRGAANPIYRDLRDGLDAYRARWGSLPQIEIPTGPALRQGASGERVRALRHRLGLADGAAFDAELARALGEYQAAHGLPEDGVAGARTVASLNDGAGHYERLIQVNMERARALPSDLGRRYVLVDTAAARLFMYEDGRIVDSMRVIVGKPDAQTPMMASQIRYAVLNPYWNVPPELVRSRIAPNVLSRGLSYLEERGYEVLSGWTGDAAPVDPATIDWAALAAGRQELRVRQRPGAGNMMGDIKFRMPNDLGIYLHDTPDRALFEESNRQLSSGCVRLEDPQRLSRWLFGRQIAASSPDPEQRVDLPRPVPIYITYFTAAPSAEGIAFRSDVYGRDAPLLAQLGGATAFASND